MSISYTNFTSYVINIEAIIGSFNFNAVITFCTNNHYFGRNLDFEYDFGEAVTVTPRNYAFSFRRAGTMHRHFAIIGMAAVDHGYPLYFDGTNEKGLSIAALYFPGNAVYLAEKQYRKKRASKKGTKKAL